MYPTQTAALKRMHAEAIKRLDALEDEYRANLERRWGQTRRALKAAILVARHETQRNQKWTHASARASGALYRMQHDIRRIMDEFRTSATGIIGTARGDIANKSKLLHAWILDQSTPPSYKVVIPPERSLQEADVDPSDPKWKARLDGWSDAYESALNHNLGMNTINGGSAADMADEVDATRAGTPSSTLFGALDRLLGSIGVESQAFGALSVVAANEGVEEIWQTRDDAKVCDECDPNLGMSQEESNGDIPNHPFCRCYWRIVPRSYAELLRGGDDGDQELAYEMSARGLVPDAMAVRDPETGDVGAFVHVGFDNWKEGLDVGVSGGAKP